MSGDVQPRKRKDKKRKRDSLDRRSEGDLVFSRKHSLQDDEPREQHQGVHGSKMGSDDVHLHVQDEHETGGHWCAKLFFFALLGILLGLVGLIILENRGLSDLDTPLSESRFSNYFDGWVDEHRESHDEHDAVSASIEEHEHGDEPFEEEEDHSEADEAEDDDDDEEKDHTEEEEQDDEEDTKENEEDDDEDATEEVKAETVEEDEETQEDDNQTEEDEDDDKTVKQPAEETKDDDDEDEDTPDDTSNDDDGNDDAEAQENDEDDDDDNEVIEPIYTRSQRSAQQASHAQSSTKEDNDDDDDDDEPFEEEDDDGTFESLESVVVDNDAEELLLLQQKARLQQDSLKKDEPQPEEETPSYTSSLAVKIGVGVALALVARLVLIRKNPNTSEPPPEALLKRRLTIASPEDTFAEDHNELLEYDYSDDHDHGIEEEYIEEEVEEEEEIEVTDEEYEEEKIEQKTDYVPETFEQFNAMYRPKGFEPEQKTTLRNSAQLSVESKTAGNVEGTQPKPETAKPSRFAQYRREETPPSPVNPRRSPQPPIELRRSPQPPLELRRSPQPPLELRRSPQPPPSVSPSHPQTEPKNVHYSDHPEEEIDYDDDEYDDEMLEEEEEEDVADDEGDEEDLSDVDDSELMNRLEAKYGRLPAKEYDSDEDVDDQSWTKIKPRGGGPQSMDDDAFEEELERANEEMLRESFNSALTLFESLSQKFPDKPEAFLGKARILDKLSELHRSNSKLSEALEAYKRYLAFGEDILSDLDFTEVAQRCVDRMRFMGLHLQAIPVHEMLIERFPDEVSHRNQLAVSYLMVNRLSDAKRVLEEILPRWPKDGFALVHYGFVLKNLNGNLEQAVQYLQNGIDTADEGTQDGRFYFNLGDSLQRLGRVEEAREVYRRGAGMKLFLSEYQRSLYNVDSLKAQAFWTTKETGYKRFLDNVESNWQRIRDEGMSVLNAKGVFQDESENLRDSGDWKQFELFARGQRRRENCMKTPLTCGIIEGFPAARFCKRGQVKFSVMHPGTHVWPHCGPTNCRLRAHLGLRVPAGTTLRVANEQRSWQEGKFLIFDDSFEHEVWHNGSSLRLVLIIDIWHPDLTEQQRQSLSPI